MPWSTSIILSSLYTSALSEIILIITYDWFHSMSEGVEIKEVKRLSKCVVKNLILLKKRSGLCLALLGDTASGLI